MTHHHAIRRQPRILSPLPVALSTLLRLRAPPNHHRHPTLASLPSEEEQPRPRSRSPEMMGQVGSLWGP